MEPAAGVTVVIATRNRRQELMGTLQRTRALPDSPAIIIVDNASTDGSADAAAATDVEVVRLARNVGAEARNIGLNLATTAVVAFSDDDSWWAPGALSGATRLLTHHPRLAVVAARVLVGPEARLDPTCAEMAASPLSSRGDLPGTPVLGFLACGAVVRRQAFQQVGGFPMGYGTGGEEGPVALALAARGWQLAYVESVVAHHHPSPARDPAGRRRRVARNDLWTAWRYRRLGSAVRRTVALGRVALTDAAVRRGLADALIAAPAVLGTRAPVPPSVEAAASAVHGW